MQFCSYINNGLFWQGLNTVAFFFILCFRQNQKKTDAVHVEVTKTLKQ